MCNHRFEATTGSGGKYAYQDFADCTDKTWASVVLQCLTASSSQAQDDCSTIADNAHSREVRCARFIVTIVGPAQQRIYREDNCVTAAHYSRFNKAWQHYYRGFRMTDADHAHSGFLRWLPLS